MGYRIAVVGATGNVGREMLNILAEREFPVDEIAALASRRSLGTEVSFGRRRTSTRSISPAGISRCSPSDRTRPRSTRPRQPSRAAS